MMSFEINSFFSFRTRSKCALIFIAIINILMFFKAEISIIICLFFYWGIIFTILTIIPWILSIFRRFICLLIKYISIFANMWTALRLRSWMILFIFKIILSLIPIMIIIITCYNRMTKIMSISIIFICRLRFLLIQIIHIILCFFLIRHYIFVIIFRSRSWSRSSFFLSILFLLKLFKF